MTVVAAWCGSGRAETLSVLKSMRVIPLSNDTNDERASVVTAVAVDPSGEWLAAAGDDHTVRVWRTQDGQLVSELLGHHDWVRSLVFHPDGTLFSAADDGVVRQWNIVTGQSIRAMARQRSVIYGMAMSPDARNLATVGFDRRLRLYDLQSDSGAVELNCPCPDMRCVAFSGYGGLLAAGGRNGRVRIWNRATNSEAMTIDAHAVRIRGLAFSPDGQRLATAGEGRKIRLWDMGSGQKIHEVAARPGKVMALLYLDADTIVTASTDNKIRAWDLQTGHVFRELVGHTGSVSSLAWNGAANLLVSGSFDTTVRLWNLAHAPAGNMVQRPVELPLPR